MIATFFGSPGAGKTTFAVKLSKKNQKKYDYCFCNFEHKISNAYICDLDGLGKWTFPDYSFICVDEAGIEYNSRAYKSLPQYTIKWLKKHRHYHCDLAIFSQSWEDMDVTIRRLSTQLWYLMRIGPFTLARRVYKRVTVDKNTEQIIDGYRMANILSLFLFPFYGWLIDRKFMIVYRPRYFKYFDSFSKDDIPVNYHTLVK